MFCNQCGTKLPEGAQFCPNCGNNIALEEQTPAPVEGQGAWQAAGQMPAPMMPASGTAKKKNWLIYGGIAVAAVLLLAVIVSAVSNLILGKGGKVLKACSATLKEAPLLVEDLKDIPQILSGDSFLVGMELGNDDLTVNGEFRNGGKDKQISLRADMDDKNLAVLCGVHSGVFQASAEGLDHAFFYDPKGENDGYLTEGFREKELEQINELLETITSDQMNTETMQKNILSAVVKEFRNLEFEDAKARNFKVDGKKRTCKGYLVSLDEKNAAGFLEAFSEAALRDMDGDTKDAAEDMVDLLIDEIRKERFDADVSFYIYKKKLAAVALEIEDEEIRLEFEGGDYRMQNMTLTVENDYFSDELTINGERKGKTETTTIAINGNEVEIVYDAKSGAVSLEGKIDGERCRLEGVYRHSGSEASCELEDIVIDGKSLLQDAGVMVYVKKKPGIEKYQGEKFDLGNASKEDFEELLGELEDYINELDDLEDYVDMIDDFL
ncbi:MAG: zinc ribbon domain-containing protein [Bacteroidales bacterium]|nr:zinc ribbon domain-containing protein [Bacteroidales bacterium]MCM1415538.1 zinc ribbon domain-containing protein [bacterium]MCM1423738.1 zinc ribbon domain-containing protein [bacterium]